MDTFRIERVVRDSLHLSNFHEEIFTEKQIEAITKAITAAIADYAKHQQS